MAISNLAFNAYCSAAFVSVAALTGCQSHTHRTSMRIRFRHWPAMLSACVMAAATVSGSPAHAASAAVTHNIASESSTGTSVIERWTPFIKEASRRFGIAEDWIKAVMRMESGGHTISATGAPITSKTGAMGLMQLMPQTWHEMQHAYGLGGDPHNPHDNVIAGTAYLRSLYQKFGFPKMFAAYNAGPGTLTQQMAGHRDLPQETRGYVSGIVRILGVKDGASHVIPVAARTTAQAVSTHAGSATATFTRPDGSEFSIDAANVVSIRTPIANEFAPGVQTVLSMGARFQGVIEKPEQVTSILRAHGARI